MARRSSNTTASIGDVAQRLSALRTAGTPTITVERTRRPLVVVMAGGVVVDAFKDARRAPRARMVARRIVLNVGGMSMPPVTLYCTRKLLDRLGPVRAMGSTVDLDASSRDEPGHRSVLGHWYANLLVVARRPLVLCAAERSLLAVVVPLQETRSFPERWRAAVARRLGIVGVPAERVAEERRGLHAVVVAAVAFGAPGDDTRAAGSATATDGPGEAWTERRSEVPLRIAGKFAGSTPSRPVPSTGRRTLGVLNDMAWQCEQYVRVGEDGRPAPDIAAMEDALERLPCGPLGSASPGEATRALFGVVGPVVSLAGVSVTAGSSSLHEERAVGGGRPVLRLLR
jgi:hypothetical protein